MGYHNLLVRAYDGDVGAEHHALPSLSLTWVEVEEDELLSNGATQEQRHGLCRRVYRNIEMNAASSADSAFQIAPAAVARYGTALCGLAVLLVAEDGPCRGNCIIRVNEVQ